MRRGKALHAVHALSQDMARLRRPGAPHLQRENTCYGGKVVLDAVMQFAQQDRLDLQSVTRFLVQTGIVKGDGGLIGEGDDELHLLLAQEITMTAVNTDTAQHVAFDLKWYAQDRMHFRRHERIMLQKTYLSPGLFPASTALNAIDVHTWSPRLHRSHVPAVDYQ